MKRRAHTSSRWTPCQALVTHSGPHLWIRTLPYGVSTSPNRRSAPNVSLRRSRSRSRDNMRNASDCAPKRCRCGTKLPQPHFHEHKLRFTRDKRGIATGCHWICERCNLSTHDKFNRVWVMNCRCGRLYVWSYHEESNGCWKIRSPLPLFDSKEIVVIA